MVLRAAGATHDTGVAWHDCCCRCCCCLQAGKRFAGYTRDRLSALQGTPTTPEPPAPDGKAPRHSKRPPKLQAGFVDDIDPGDSGSDDWGQEEKEMVLGKVPPFLVAVRSKLLVGPTSYEIRDNPLYKHLFEKLENFLVRLAWGVAGAAGAWRALGLGGACCGTDALVHSARTLPGQGPYSRPAAAAEHVDACTLGRAVGGAHHCQGGAEGGAGAEPHGAGAGSAAQRPGLGPRAAHGAAGARAPDA